MAKRFLLTAAFVLLGAAITVAVAWGWAAWGVPPHIDARTWSLSHDDAPFWIMREYAGAGAAITHVKPELRTGQHVGVMQRLANLGPEVPAHVRDRFAERPAHADTYMRYAFDERGWPWRCLSSEHTYRWVNRPDRFIAEVGVSGGIQLWPEQTQRGGWALQRVRALPLRPIWPAFIANTIVYALVATIVMLGYPRMTRVLGTGRSARRALVATMLAPVLVLGVAWFAAWPGARSLNQGGQRTNGMNVERQDRLAATRVVFSGGSFQGFDNLPAPPMENVAPRWSAPWREAAARELNSFDWTTAEGAGWPWRAFASCFRSQALPNLTIGVTIECGIPLDPLPSGLDIGAAYHLRVLPTEPLWTGLILNWLLYAFVLFGLISLPEAIKRGWRQQFGRCIECGYDLRYVLAGGCPECGWRRAA